MEVISVLGMSLGSRERRRKREIVTVKDSQGIWVYPKVYFSPAPPHTLYPWTHQDKSPTQKRWGSESLCRVPARLCKCVKHHPECTESIWKKTGSASDTLFTWKTAAVGTRRGFSSPTHVGVSVWVWYNYTHHCACHKTKQGEWHGPITHGL